MTSTKLSLFFFLIAMVAALRSSMVGAETAKKDLLIMAEGVVLCQDCQFVGSWDLLNSKALYLAKVGITCRDMYNRVACYKTAETDKNGYFIATLDDPRMKKVEDPEKTCKVRLLAPPKDSSCSLLTNVNYGIQGSLFYSENKTYSEKHFDVKIYSTQPLAFKPKHCAPRSKY